MTSTRNIIIEALFKEKKPLTYKILCRRANIKANQAKKEMEDFLDDPPPGEIHVVVCVSGISLDGFREFLVVLLDDNLKGFS
jgi:hypothetical protein